jgi:hypothetical protein
MIGGTEFKAARAFASLAGVSPFSLWLLIFELWRASVSVVRDAGERRLGTVNELTPDQIAIGSSPAYGQRGASIRPTPEQPKTQLGARHD